MDWIGRQDDSEIRRRVASPRAMFTPDAKKHGGLAREYNEQRPHFAIGNRRRCADESISGPRPTLVAHDLGSPAGGLRNWEQLTANPTSLCLGPVLGAKPTRNSAVRSRCQKRTTTVSKTARQQEAVRLVKGMTGPLRELRSSQCGSLCHDDAAWR